MNGRDGRRVARWLAERVRQVAPPGLGLWDRAWSIVEAPSAAFLEALAAWEETGSAEDQAAVQDAAAAVVAAWRAAAEEWDRAGRPDSQSARERETVTRQGPPAEPIAPWVTERSGDDA